MMHIRDEKSEPYALPMARVCNTGVYLNLNGVMVRWITVVCPVCGGRHTHDAPVKTRGLLGLMQRGCGPHHLPVGADRTPYSYLVSDETPLADFEADE